MSSKPFPWNRVVLVLGIALVMLVAGIVGYSMQQSFKESSVVTSGQPLIGGRFELIDHDGKARSEKDFAGQNLLIYFGFTYCPDICPTELAKIATAIDALPADANVTPVFITIDPERDGVEEVKAYAEAFHPKMVGLTGSIEQIKQVTQAYRVYYAKAGTGAGQDYLMNHSSIIYFMGKDGQYIEHFNVESTAEQITERVRKEL
ncbi:MAG: SCO family protein [Alphaproteobacteria bacterium]|jgi:protein SCO1/2